MEILKNPNFDFLGKTRYFVAVSLVTILAGLGYMLTNKVYLGRDAKGYGVEFSGGTQLIAKFQSSPEIDRVRSAVTAVAPGAVIQTYGDPRSNQVLIRVAGAEADNLDATANRVRQSLATNYAQNPVVEASSELVGPVVGAELRRKAIQLTVLGLLFQLVYIGFRFKGAVWGAAATVAVLHDVLVTLAFLAFFGYEITLNVIAALLTLVGYSVNDTIVIFDRAREILRHNRKDPLRKVLNDALNQTLTRTLISNGTTFLSVLGLFLFGGEEAELGAMADRVKQSLAASYSENPVLEASSEVVGPVVGTELRRKAIQLTVLGLLFQLVYIGFRFKGAVWGAAATVAVLHDVLVTLAFLASFGYEITLNVIAALLTLVGYSVNDTIVIFDRAREILRHNRKDPLRKILNDALNQTLTRTLISNGTTFLSVLGLFLFGGEVLRGFGFTMVIGILVGTYSTIYIASPIVAWWTGRTSRPSAAAPSSNRAAARAAL
ncbi:MAG TPA: protein translocase subunit SecF [Vicinamibacteria bacterium]|nr:protein translocase subunit SecF [Vicinamibacteria bacterium]